ncbi:MAG: isochorismate synthase [Candidatus Hydrogenedentes bacterium]|nr:isochorismate synthase [Candidatus Hydrogenedentota bacterium]
MSGRDSLSAPVPAMSAPEALAAQIREAWAGGAAPPGAARSGMFRAEIAIEPVEPLGWLCAQADGEKVYWGGRDGALELAGIGVADALSGDARDVRQSFRTIAERLARASRHTRYLGGLRFNVAAEGDPAWAGFGAHRFVLPRFEIERRDDGSTWLACNALIGEGGATDVEQARLLADLGSVRFPGDAAGTAALPAPAESRADRPEHAEWLRMVDWALEHERAGRVEKVVLARESRLRFREALDPLTVLGRLAEGAVQAYRFCFQPARGAAFIGASPERLYTRRNRHLDTEAVAGTRPRGRADDAALRAELLSDDKELREHRFVIDGIRAGLESICEAVAGDPEVSVLQLRHCEHLFARLEGELRAGVTDADILEALHPTPAVGGVPTAEALRWIAALEPFDRGWYAGPVGWVGREEAEFAVALRSGLVAGETLRLYAGAGIVAGSQGEREWAELESKVSGFLDAVGVGEER